MSAGQRLLVPANADVHADLSTFLGRVGRLAPDSLVRLTADAGTVRIWTIVLGVLVRRDIRAQLAGSTDATVRAPQLLEAAQSADRDRLQITLPSSADDLWRATLPPSSGFEHRQDLPLSEVTYAVEFAGSQLLGLDDLSLAAVSDNLLKQPVLMVGRDSADPIEIPLRTVVVMTRLGFLAQTGQDAEPVVRVASTAAWTVVATPIGAAFARSTTTNLLGLL